MPRRFPPLPFLALAAPLAAAGQTLLAPEVVTATRTPTPAAQVPFAVTTVDAAALRAAPVATLDDALRAVPGFTLFRRSGSFSANPSAQGVSLRGLGPSGASRSLVVLDGIPVTDPFGGWVSWSKLPRENLARAELVRGGGAAAWGNATLGGVVQLLSDDTTAPGGRLAVLAGDFGTRSAEFASRTTAGPVTLTFSGRAFATDGFSLVAPEDRGPVDLAAWSRHRWLGAQARTTALPGGLALGLTARVYEEHRGNGTPYQQNGSREAFVSTTLARPSAEPFAWTATAYAQDQSFASTFGSVNATRTAETPASDQYAVPAVALGAAWTGVWRADAASSTSAGLDARTVRGETREHFTYSATLGDFTRGRIAGGAQTFAGVFIVHERALASRWRATLGARLDAWRDTNGHRRETDRATGVFLRNETYATRRDLEFSPSAGLVWTPAPAWRIRTAAQRAFRRPTLNELYRPFRVGNVITEANAALRTEHVTASEVGVDFAPGAFAFTSAVFRHDFRDAVGNVTLVRGPGTYPLFGFIPAGGLGRQKLSLDRLVVQGAELSARWTPSPHLTLHADYLYNDATVTRAAAAPALVGRRLAQVPRHTVGLGATWRTPWRLTFTPRARVLGRQFEDDENRLVLGRAVVVDLGASLPLSACVELFASVENLTDARIETGRNDLGVVNTGTPRLALLGLRGTW